MRKRHCYIDMAFAADQVDRAQLEVGTFSLGRDMHFLAHQLAAGIHDEQRQLGIRADMGVELANLNGVVAAFLINDPDHIRAVANYNVGHR